MMYDELIKRLRRDATAFTGFVERDLKEAADAIEAMSELALDEHNRAAKLASKPRWIPLSEKLPEENAPCIVYNKDYGPMVGWRVDGERFRIPGSRFPDHPTHWMPLPKGPEEE